MAESGNSVVMVTHDRGAVDYCGQGVTLGDGRIGADERTATRHTVDA
ncbi:hypothetical protein [Nocardia grenadensis]